MAVIRITTNFNIDLEFEAAPFHRRLMAWGIDLLLQIFYLILAAKIFTWWTRDMDNKTDTGYNRWGLFLLLLLPFFTYHVVCEILFSGQSIGKKLMGLRVVNEAGGKPAISQCIIRWLIRTSDYTLFLIILFGPLSMLIGGESAIAGLAAFLLLFIDIILANSGKKNQRLGDILAHTMLIKSTQNGTINDTVFLPVADDYVPQFPQVMNLTDRDINSIKGILDASRKKRDYELADRASNKIKNHLFIESSLSSFAFLEILLKDYNKLSVK
ncbi:MAG TPA: RDD family protein [Chitinophagaceae bacterium]|nr:RDD family protein [Chitinophagaceae bacterium]